MGPSQLEILISTGKGEKFSPENGLKLLCKHLRQKWSVEVSKNVFADNMLARYRTVIFSGPEKKFSMAEFAALRHFFENGGNIFFWLGEGGESSANTNVNYLLEDYGMLVNPDAVIRAAFLKYLLPKEAIISDGYLQRVSTKAAETGNSGSFLFPYGATMKVKEPAIPLLTSGSACYPVHAPLCGLSTDPKGGKIMVLSSVLIFHDNYIEKEENFMLMDRLFSLLWAVKIPRVLPDESDVPETEAICDMGDSATRMLPVLAEDKFLPTDISLGYDSADEATDLAAAAIGLKTYAALKTQNQPLTLVPPQFEGIYPSLEPAVYLPEMVDLTRPDLEMFDFNLEFMSERDKLRKIHAEVCYPDVSGGRREESDLFRNEFKRGEILFTTLSPPFVTASLLSVSPLRKRCGSGDRGSPDFAVTFNRGFAAVNGLQCPGQDWFYRKGTDTCYYISNPNAGDASSPPVVITNWNEVVQECINRGGALLTIEDENELDWIRGKINSESNYYWIGLTFQNLTWQWYDGKTYRPYTTIVGLDVAPLTAIQSNAYRRGSLRYDANTKQIDFFLDWSSATNRNQFICKGDWNGRPRCKNDEGWSYHDGVCHKFNPYPTYFANAERICYVDGGYIAVINSQSEDSRMKSWLRDKVDVERGWLGINIVNKNASTTIANVKWLDGTPIDATAVKNWKTNNLTKYIQDLPNGQSYCGEVSTAVAYDYYWDDEYHDWYLRNSCSESRPYMCEAPLNKCPYGWKGLDDDCYQFNTGEDDLRSWEAARNNCKLEMGDLADIKTDRVQVFIKDVLYDTFQYSMNGLQHFWIGLRANGGSYKWPDSSAASYAAWTAGQAPDASRDPCVYIDGNSFASLTHGDWNTSACTQSFGYICKTQHSAVIPPSNVIHPEHTCDNGFTKYHEGCYLINPEPMNRDDAQRFCESKQSTLAIINTFGENLWLTARIQADSWIGIKKTHGTWAYMDYEYSTGYYVGEGAYLNFAYDSTLNPDSETFQRNCVAMAGPNNTYFLSGAVSRPALGKWYHLKCDELKAVICSHPGEPIPRPPPDNDHYDAQCGAGWFRNGRNCYRVQSNYESWYGAKQACQNYGKTSDLLYITSKEEERYISETLLGNYSYEYWDDWLYIDSLWIDLYSEEESHWYWPYRQSTDKWHIPLSVLNWASDEPWRPDLHTARSPRCAYLYTEDTDLRWYSTRCNYVNAYVCKKVLPQMVPISPPTAAPLPAGFHYGCKDWINFENRCVHFSIDGLDWNQARQFCRNKQGDLVTVKNQLEFDRFKMFGNGAWIGLNAIRDPGGPRVFEWSNGAEMTYTPWDVESPTGSVNGNGTINCGGMTSRGFAMYPCGEVKTFICEKPLEVIEGAVTGGNLPTSPGCKTGGTYYRQYCYYFGEDPLSPSPMNARPFQTFNEAIEFCKDRFDASLVIIKSADEQEFLNLMLARTGADFWIGLREDSNPWNAFKKWIDNSTVTRTNWAFGQPPVTHTGSLGCIAMHGLYRDNTLPGDWYMEDCDQKLNALCKGDSTFHPPTPTLPSSTPSPTGCPRTWKTKPEFPSCYKAYQGTISGLTTKVNWETAEAFCRNFRQGHLVSVSSSEENSFIDFQVQPNFQTGYYYWIGLRQDEYDHSKWVWSDGSPVTSTWFHTSLNHETAGVVDCVAIESMSGRWVTQSCQQGWGWMCEIPKGAYYEGEAIQEFPMASAINTTCGNSSVNGDWYYDRESMECLFWSRNKDSWENAQTNCESMGANLVTVTDGSHEFISLKSSQMVHTSDSFWIGLHQLDFVNHEFAWVDGHNSQFRAWAPGQPSGDGTEQCVVHSTYSGKWSDRNCGQQYRFICARSGRIRPPRPTYQPAVGNCASGWVPHGDHCFYFSENVNVSWSDAVTQCANNLTADRPLVAGNLVSIHDSMETDFLVSLMRGRHHYDFWIGLHAAVEDTGSYRQWVWSDQSRYGFTNWRFGENENWSSQKRDCVAMGSSPRHAGQWYISDCTKGRGFICKAPKDPNAPVQPPLPPSKCPAGYTQYGDTSCFTVQKLETGQTWQDAQNLCKNLGDKYGDIATAVDIFDNAAFRMLLADAMWTHHGMRNHSGLAWIGMKEHLGTFAWHNTCPVVFSNLENIFAVAGQDSCVAMNRHGGWQIHDCSHKADFAVCERRLAPCPAVHDSVEDNYCSNDFPQECRHMCYRVEGIRSSNNNRSRSLSRAAAETRCRDLKGHLASIRTQEEQTCLIGYLAHVNEPMWIGLYELQLPDSKYSWKWEDESFSFEAASYANWDAGYPKNSTSPYYRTGCVEMTTEGKWRNSQCNSYDSKGYICETAKLWSDKPRQTTTLPPTDINGVRPDPKTGLAGGSVAGIVIGVLLAVAIVGGIGYVVMTGKTAAVVGSVRSATTRVKSSAGSAWSTVGFQNRNYEQHSEHSDKKPVSSDFDGESYS